MAYRLTGVAVLLATLPAVGCGTVANLARPGPEAGGKAPFGGVRHDMGSIRRAANGDFAAGADNGLTSEQLGQAARVVVYALDLPLSLIADVITWPYVMAYSIVNQPVPVPPVILAPPTGPRVPAAATPGVSPGMYPSPDLPPSLTRDDGPAAGR